jgi:hypothetical protein
VTGLKELLVSLIEGAPGVELDHKRNHVSAKVQGRVFAYDRPHDLVVKLPKSRIDELEAAGEASRLVMGKREMAEWAVVQGPPAVDAGRLKVLLDDSIAFVSRD